MLEIAQKRLGHSAKLFQADIVSMSIPDRFDVAISNGGLCALVDTGRDCDFSTHLTDDESNLRSLQNVANCLDKGGLFIINIQGLHDNYDKALPEGIVYSQYFFESTTHPDCIEKTFYCKNDERILAQQQLIYMIFKGEAIEDIFNRASFKLAGKDKSGQLFM